MEDLNVQLFFDTYECKSKKILMAVTHKIKFSQIQSKNHNKFKQSSLKRLPAHSTLRTLKHRTITRNYYDLQESNKLPLSDLKVSNKPCSCFCSYNDLARSLKSKPLYLLDADYKRDNKQCFDFIFYLFKQRSH